MINTLEPDAFLQKKLFRDVLANLQTLQESADRFKASYLSNSRQGSDREANILKCDDIVAKPSSGIITPLSSETQESFQVESLSSNFVASINVPGLVEKEIASPSCSRGTYDDKLGTILALRKIWSRDEIKKCQPQIWAAIEPAIKQFEVRPFMKRLNAHSSNSLESEIVPTNSICFFDSCSSVLPDMSRRQPASKHSRNNAESCIIHPDSLFKLGWEMACLFQIIYDATILPMQAFEHGHPAFFVCLEWLATVFWTTDLCLSFRTGYHVGLHVEMHQKTIARHYLKTWFVFDFIIVILEWVSQFDTKDISSNFARVRGIMRVAVFTRIIRVIKVRMVWHRALKQIKNETYVLCLGLFTFCMVVLIILHIFTCIWYAIGCGNSSGWTSDDDHNGETNVWFWYMTSARWVVAQLNGRTDMDPRRTIFERAFTILAGLVLGVVVKSVFTGMITRSTFQIYKLNSEMRRRNWFMLEYLESNPVSKTLKHNIRQYLYDYEESAEQREACNVVSALPSHVQEQLFLEIRGPLLCGCGAIDALRDHKILFKQLCSVIVQPVICVTDEVLFTQHDACIRMLTVDKGVLNYTRENDNAPMLAAMHNDLNTSSEMVQAGALVSEAALWYDWHNRGTLSSMGVCTIYELRVRELQRLLERSCAYTRGEEAYAFATLYAERYQQEAQHMMAAFDDLTRIFLEVKRRNNALY